MNKKKKPTTKAKDPHLVKSFTFRFDPIVRQQMELLAKRNRSKLTEEIRKSCIETLKQNGLWPTESPP